MSEARFEAPPESLVQGIVQLFRELYMEIFAIIVPGLFFFILMVPALAIPAADALEPVWGPYTRQIGGFLTRHIGLVVFALLIMSYIVGHILFRNDPKWPDILSIRSLPEEARRNSCVRGHLTGPVTDMEEFPYGALKDYLVHRNFHDLAALITWEEADFTAGKNEKFHRSKHLINQYKLSIKLHHPSMYFEIARNETHIRLMSSLWYLSLAIIIASGVGLAMGVGLNIGAYVDGAPIDLTRPALHGEAVLYPLGAMLLAGALMFINRKFFHYQRVREIIYVLKLWTLVDPDRRKIPINAT